MLTTRQRLATLMGMTLGPSTPGSRWLDAFLILLILSNTVIVILESVPAYHAAYGDYFGHFEHFCVAVFTLEYLARVWAAVELPAHAHPVRGRLSYMLTPLAVIDLLAILPYYLHMLIGVDLLFLRVVRLLRIFKLTRYSAAMQVLFDVFREEGKALGAAFFVLFILLILASSGIYLIEHEAQPEDFGSIPDAMWWAIVTLTTVGYGDATPATPLGKIFGGLITIIGMGMVALPAGILASGFSDQVHRRRLAYSERLQSALKDGMLTRSEEAELHALRHRLGLSEEDTLDILKTITTAMRRQVDTCPHCHKSLLQGPVCELEAD